MTIQTTRERIREHFPKTDDDPYADYRIPRETFEEIKYHAARHIWKKRYEFLPKRQGDGPLRQRWYEWFIEKFGEDVHDYAKRMAAVKRRGRT